MELFYFFNIN